MLTDKLEWDAWSETLSVGIDGIDADHKAILDLIARLHKAYDAPGAESAVRLAVAHIGAYAEHHFQREEHMLDMAGYPYLVQHKARHDTFRAYAAAIAAGAADLPEVGELLSWLVDWWVGHIGTEDRMYRPYVETNPDAIASVTKTAGPPAS